MNTDDGTDIWESVTLCAAHPVTIDPDCEHCDAEMLQRGQVMDALQEEGNTRAAGLAQTGIQMPREVMAQVRGDLMVEAMFQDPRQRTLFEAEFGRRMVNTLKEAQKQANTAALLPDRKLTVVKNGVGLNGMKKG